MQNNHNKYFPQYFILPHHARQRKRDWRESKFGVSGMDHNSNSLQQQQKNKFLLRFKLHGSTYKSKNILLQTIRFRFHLKA
jgi:chemotaxis receptor (MCP) glutamine deamidase CheD